MKDMIEQELMPQIDEIRQISKWKSYEKYKASNSELLDAIPEHWVIGKLKQLCRKITRGNSPEYVDESQIPVINQACIHQEALRLENVKYQKEVDVSKWKGCLSYGDVLINSTGTGTLGRVTLFNLDGTWLADSHVTIVRSNTAVITPSYLVYLMHSPLYQRYIYTTMVSGSTNQIELSKELLKSSDIIVPSRSEQQAIAVFLDRETAKINTLIAKREHMIELLQERRTAVINQAVTKGLHPAVKMKDSGVEWLREIPEHWEVRRIKHGIHSIIQGWSPLCENRLADAGEWGVLKVGCVNGTEFDELEHKALPKETEPIPDLEVKAGDILISRANTRELLGSTSIVRNIRPRLLLCDKLYRLKVDQGILVPEFFVLIMGSSAIRYQIERDATGASSSMQNISQFTILNLILSVPPVSEQKTIVSYLYQETTKIDKLISRIEQSIQKLKEYKVALISAAVTGKIDVRNEVDAINAQSAENVAG